MKLLALLRHAKAVKDDPGGDHARPLAEVGRQAAEMAGQRLRNCLPADVLVVASDACRTRQTAGLAFPSCEASRFRLEPALYAASSAALLAFVRGLSADISAAALVGHNPGISELASTLAGQGDAKDLARLAEGLSTADAVVLTFPNGWGAVAPGAGRVTALLVRQDTAD